MKTIINEIIKDWKRVKNHCRTTVNKEFTDKKPDENLKSKLLISEHSPIRLLEVDWSWRGIKYWVAMEWARHKFEKFIASQRNDRQNNYDRNGARQDSPVNFDGYANAQNLIDAWRKRLCHCATKEARELAEDFKSELGKVCPELADVLVPNCIYRFGCPEFKPCGYFDKFLKWVAKKEFMFTDIRSRYIAYNEFVKELLFIKKEVKE